MGRVQRQNEGVLAEARIELAHVNVCPLPNVFAAWKCFANIISATGNNQPEGIKGKAQTCILFRCFSVQIGCKTWVIAALEVGDGGAGLPRGQGIYGVHLCAVSAGAHPKCTDPLYVCTGRAFVLPKVQFQVRSHLPMFLRNTLTLLFGAFRCR
jgi:hypothetical protein